MAGGTAPAALAKVNDDAGERGSYAAPLSALASLFFLWGFLTALNDTLIPHLKAVFELSYASAMLVQSAFFIAYFLVSVPAGKLIHRIGYKNGLLLGLGVMAVGCLLFYPAAGLRSYASFLFALFMLAGGIATLQVAANPFVAALGPSSTASSRLTLTQALNSLGTTLAPWFGALVILSREVKSPAELGALGPSQLDAYRAAEASTVQLPYVGLAVTLVVIAVAIAAIRLPVINVSGGEGGETSGGALQATRAPRGRRAGALAFPQLRYGMVAIFIYVGAEVAIGSFLTNFLQDPNVAGLSPQAAGRYVSYYWGGAMVGRFIGTTTLRRWRPSRVLAAHGIAAALLVALAALGSGQLALVAVIAVGLCNSVMFPTIFTLAIDGLGELASEGSGLLCMAIFGGGVIAPLQGLVADRVGVQHAYLLSAVCYLYIVWYGWRGSRPARPAVA